MGERGPERESPELLLEEVNHRFENGGELGLERFSEAERNSLVELLYAKVVEVEPGPLKNKYRQLLSDALLALGNLAQVRQGKKEKPIISDEYRLLAGGEEVTLRAGVFEMGDYSETMIVDDTIKATTLDYDKSAAHLITVAGENHTCLVNMKLFNVVLRNGKRKKLLYIADRYVAAPLRGKGIGEKLLGIAEGVAKSNGCSLIFQRLIPENPADMDLLKKGTEKLGYKTREQNRTTLSIKRI